MQVFSQENYKPATKRINLHSSISIMILFICVIAYIIDKSSMFDIKEKLEFHFYQDNDQPQYNITRFINELNEYSAMLSSVDNMQCIKILNRLRINSFESNLLNYSFLKSVLYYLIRIMLLLASILLVMYLLLSKSLKNNKLLKKSCFGITILSLCVEYIILIIYMSVYLKNFHVFSFLDKTLSNNCLEGLKQAQDVLSNFIVDVANVYNVSLLLILFRFLTSILLLYMLKLLIIINLLQKSTLGDHIQMDDLSFLSSTTPAFNKAGEWSAGSLPRNIPLLKALNSS
jgi:hypothetical protein